MLNAKPVNFTLWVRTRKLKTTIQIESYVFMKQKNAVYVRIHEFN